MDSPRLTPDRRRYWNARARVMKALAHPTRLFLLDELGRGERCVCELTALVGDDISTVSKHLAVLRRVGLVSDERRANQVFYRLEAPCVGRFFDCADTVLAAAAEAQLEVVGPDTGRR